jgi:hypothetical protein
VRRAAAVAATLVLLAGCGGSGETSLMEVKEALKARLVGKKLSFEWVYCLRTKLAFEGRPIVRCNVNFGEPHIVIYCATLEGGELVTNREQPGIRCGRTITAPPPVAPVDGAAFD